MADMVAQAGVVDSPTVYNRIPVEPVAGDDPIHPARGRAMTEELTPECQALRAEIDGLQKEFEGLWLAVSAGATPTPRYRELRRTIDELRARYATECGVPHEDTSLPRHITSDWRAG
jgi:hypothetical protein